MKHKMTLRDIARLLDAEVLTGEDKLDTEAVTACGSDLMSDVLAFVKDKTILITGLVNAHVIRTAEMLDIIQAVIFLFFAAEQFLSKYRQKLVVKTAQEELAAKAALEAQKGGAEHA